MSDAREEAVRRLLPLLRGLARRVHRLIPAADFDDLIGDGCIGLLQAVDRYDPQRGSTLPRYARRLIVGAMLNGLRRMDPVSERVRRLIREADRQRYATAATRGCLPTQAEDARERPALAAARAAALRAQPLSLDAPLPDGCDPVLDWSNDPAAIVADALAGAAMRRAIAGLSQRQRRVVIEHYYAGRSLRAIGRDIGISAQRSSQIHLAALERLRAVHRA